MKTSHFVTAWIFGVSALALVGCQTNPQSVNAPRLIDARDQAAVVDAMPKDVKVAATVTSIDVSDSVISIHFAGTDKSNLYAVVLRAGREEILSAYGDHLQKLQGKSIQIVGKIVDYRGKPEIVISKPDQISIIG